MKNTAPLNRSASVALACTLVLALAGCASSDGLERSAQSLPLKRLGLDANVATPALASDWWRDFGDAALNDLMERALLGNPSLKVAQARLARVQAAAAGVRSSAGPQVNASLDVTREHFSATSIYPPPLGGANWTLSNAQIGASWELDLFGRQREAIAAAVGTQRAAQAELQAAHTVLATQLASHYVQLARLQAQRGLAARSLAQREEMLALVRQRVQAGLDSGVELRLSEGALPEMRQQLEQLDEQITLRRHALAALSAQSVSALDGLQAPLATLQVKALPEPLGADLLGRRADLSALRWRVQAASSQVQSAQAQFYPNINLNAFVGLASIGLDRLLQTRSEQYGAGPAIHLPIFDSGRLRANLQGRNAELDETIAVYHQAVLEAVRDASDQIASTRSIRRQQEQQTQSQDSAASAYALATERYQAGLGSYLLVLNAESALLNQRRQHIDLMARALDTRVALVRALGGGYADDLRNSGGDAPDLRNSGGDAPDLRNSGGDAPDSRDSRSDADEHRSGADAPSHLSLKPTTP